MASSISSRNSFWCLQLQASSEAQKQGMIYESIDMIVLRRVNGVMTYVSCALK